MNTPLSRFRFIGILEGISFLVLLGIGMPLKYMAGIPEVVKYVGWAHGILFILYMMALLQVVLAYNWSFAKAAFGFVASLLPFGPFILDKKLLKSEEAAKEEPQQKQAV